MLLIVADAAVGAEMINLEGITGAFLAGLAVNRAARGREAKQELGFIGNSLSVPSPDTPAPSERTGPGTRPRAVAPRRVRRGSSPSSSSAG